MAGELKNISKLFQNTRTRAILVVTIGLVLIMFVTGIIHLNKRLPKPKTEISLQGAPSGMGSVPGGFEQPETTEYVKLQTQQNVEQAKQAQLSGGSAVPTIVSSSTLSGAWQGGNFSSLNQTLPNNYLLRSLAQAGGPADAEGIPVYNQQGLMTGLAYGKGAAGRVCVMDCTAVGTVGPDGLIRDAKGNVIGKVASSALGTPVYDSQGRLIGYAGADGKVRDLKGNVIGSIGPDGVFKTNSGAPGGGALGVPVYDSNGRLIGYAGPDGKVRGLNGNVIGTLGPDGTVRDLKGNVIGKAGSSQLGTPIYDAQGRLIGYAGPDGKVRDINGNVVGTVGPDGVVRNASGKIIGKTTPPVVRAVPLVPSGTPVYDSQGRLIGYASPDGTVRDPSGKVIGNLAADGTLRDANGNIIGRAGGTAGAGAITPTTTAPGGVAGGQNIPNSGISAIAPSENDQLQAVRQRQALQLEQQKIQQNQQQLSSSMNSQQGLLFAAWTTTPPQQYVEGEKDKEGKEGAGKSGTGAGAAGASALGKGGPATVSCEPPLIKAGTILFGVLNTGVNSDQPGPVMASVVGTQLKGGKLLGTLVYQRESVMLTFNVLTLPNTVKSISINAVAIDPDTAKTALSSDTDHHYLLRYGSLFASSFMQGYGQAVQQSGATVVSNGLNTVTNMPTLSPKGEALSALGTVGQNWGQAIRGLFDKPPTVQVYSGTALGILFLQDVTAPPC